MITEKNFKSFFFFFFLVWPCITLQAPFQRHICGSDVPKIFCLQHPGIVANWTDFKPPFQNEVHSSLGCLLFAAIYLIYTKWINPKFATESECNHIYIYIYIYIYVCVSFGMRMFLSDIWSTSNFWVTVHASWVLMSVTHLDWISHFCCKCWRHSLDLFEWFWWYLWPKMALEMPQEFPTVTLDIINKASPRLSLVEKFAKIAVYK